MHRFRVRHLVTNAEEELFKIITGHRTVEITFKRHPSENKTAGGNRKVYTYNKDEITNVCLMKRIIDAIAQYTAVA